MMLYKYKKSIVRSFDGNADFFDIVVRILQGDTLAPYLFILYLDYVFQTSVELIKTGFIFKRQDIYIYILPYFIKDGWERFGVKVY